MPRRHPWPFCPAEQIDTWNTDNAQGRNERVAITADTDMVPFTTFAAIPGKLNHRRVRAIAETSEFVGILGGGCNSKPLDENQMIWGGISLLGAVRDAGAVNKLAHFMRGPEFPIWYTP